MMNNPTVKEFNMGYPVSKNYMDQGGDRWTVGPEGEFQMLGFMTGGLYVKRYFVDNVNGDDANGGESWDTAFEQIAAAVTAWEAYRLAQANVYARGAIFIRGTGTAYTKLTALPNYCDMIGVGADPRGNGTGIAAITGGSSAAAIAGSARGLGLYNLQFIGAGAVYAAAFAVLFRSDIENCTFVNGATGGLDITTGGGVVIRNCQIGGDTVTPATGMRVGSAGGNFNNCLVEDNVIYGSTTGFENGAYLCNQTVVRRNFIYGGTKGVDDNSAETTLAGNAWYVGNYIGSASDAMEFTQNGAVRAIGNYINENGTSAYEDGI